MASPRCLRTAIETCRPCKSSSLVMRIRASQPSAHRVRQFASTGPKYLLPKDITSGFPTPEVGSRKIQAFEEESHKHEQEATTPTRTQDISQPSDAKSDNAHAIAQSIIASAGQEGPHVRNAGKPPHASPTGSLESPDTSVATKSPVLDETSGSLEPDKVNVPPNVLAAFRTAIRHTPTHGIPVASLQLRSYSVRNLEFFADFAVRAAYWLNLPLSGPVPLPKIIERWTVPKSPFIFKKTQENFERITRRRLLTVYDGHPSVVETWLAFIRKWQFYGVGMKANVWSFEGLDVAKTMDKQFDDLEKELDEKLRLYGFSQAAAGNRDLLRMMMKQGVRGPGVGATDVRDKSRVGHPSTEGDVI